MADITKIPNDEEQPKQSIVPDIKNSFLSDVEKSGTTLQQPSKVVDIPSTGVSRIKPSSAPVYTQENISPTPVPQKETTKIKKDEIKNTSQAQADNLIREQKALTELAGTGSTFVNEQMNKELQARQKQLGDDTDQANVAKEEAIKQLSNADVKSKDFWSISTTGQKIGTALDALAGIAFAYGNRPDLAQKSLDNANKTISAVVEQDLANQKLNYDRLAKKVEMSSLSAADKIKQLQNFALQDSARIEGTWKNLANNYLALANTARLAGNEKIAKQLEDASENLFTARYERERLQSEQALAQLNQGHSSEITKDVVMKSGVPEVLYNKDLITKERDTAKTNKIAAEKALRDTGYNAVAEFKNTIDQAPPNTQGFVAYDLVATALKQMSTNEKQIAEAYQKGYADQVNQILLKLKNQSGQIDPDTWKQVQDFAALKERVSREANKGGIKDLEYNTLKEQSYDKMFLNLGNPDLLEAVNQNSTIFNGLQQVPQGITSTKGYTIEKNK